jgi:CheY-like chemotaxis protein
LFSERDWKVLLIDDDEDDYFIIRSILNSNNHRKISLEWKQNSHEALQALQQEMYDTILVDYHLGEENGAEVIQYLSKSGIIIPMILLSGSGSYQIDQKAMEAGACFYFEKKDLSPQILERIIRYAIGCPKKAGH